MLSAAALTAAISVGCGKSPPPVTDLSKAPWLDPKVQAEGLKQSDMRLRGLSAVNLGKIGAPAADALPALEELAQSDPEPKVRKLAREAIDKIRAASDGQ
jgi:hypothetical protein